MHGRPREAKDAPKDEEKEKLKQQKAAAFAKLCNEVLKRRQQKLYDEASLALCGSLLELNPEVYTAWNYRREAVRDLLAQGGELAVKAAEQELALTERALKKNPKSYAAWHHRRWVVEQKLTSLDVELQLVSKLLSLDDRNFHGWNYRRFVCALKEVSPEDELAYTQAKINANFSNYSAWHSRTKLLPQAHATQPTLSFTELLAQGRQEGGSTGPRTLLPSWVLAQEFELVQQALWTEPEDQSGWFYHRWLLGAALAARQAAQGTSQEAAAQEELLCTMSREASMCQQLLDMEPDAKWPLLTKARILKAMDDWTQASHRQPATLSPANPSPEAPVPAQRLGATEELGVAVEPKPSAVAGQDAPSSAAAQSRALYERLIDLDPLRAGYYKDEVQGSCQAAQDQRGHLLLSNSQAA